MPPRGEEGSAHHLPLLRRGLRRAGDARRQGWRGDCRRSGAPRQLRQAVLERLGARRYAGPRRPAALSGDRRAAGRMGRGDRSRRLQHRAHRRCAWARRDRLLSLGTAADRGLLRRQQAGQGLHRHAARRYQFAPVHGLLRRRPPPGVRRRHRAPVLRRPGACRSRGPRRLQRGLVPPDPLPAHPGGPRRARRARRQHRSAPHRHQRGRRSASRHQTRHRRPAVERPPQLAQRLQRAGSALHRRAHRGLRGGACQRPHGGRARGPGRASDRPSQQRHRAVLLVVDDQRAGRHLLFAGREPVGARHRQGQRHHQLPSRHRPHRQARGGAAVADRPAQRHGRARGRRARQHARRPHGLLAGRARSRAPVLGCAEPRRGRRPQGRADVRGGGRRRHQARCG